MNAYKDTMLDDDGNIIYPKTTTDNVFTPNGERLDNVLEDINIKIPHKIGVRSITIPTVTLASNYATLKLGNYWSGWRDVIGDVHNIINIQTYTWSSGQYFSVCLPYSTDGDFYINGNNGTIINLSLKIVYIEP